MTSPLTRADVERLLAEAEKLNAPIRVIAYRQLLASMEENEWRSIDSAPKDGTRILIFEPDGTAEFIPGTTDLRDIPWVDVVRWFSPYDGPDGWYGWEDSLSTTSPTHWRPLPSPPSPKG